MTTSLEPRISALLALDPHTLAFRGKPADVAATLREAQGLVGELRNQADAARMVNDNLCDIATLSQEAFCAMEKMVLLHSSFEQRLLAIMGELT